MQDGGMSAIQSGDEVVSAAEHKALLKKVKQPKQLLGRKNPWSLKLLKGLVANNKLACFLPDLLSRIHFEGNASAE